MPVIRVEIAATGEIIIARVQEPGKWMTRYVLDSLGVMVTIYEIFDEKPQGWFNTRDYRIEQVVVEPTAANRT